MYSTRLRFYRKYASSGEGFLNALVVVKVHLDTGTDIDIVKIFGMSSWRSTNTVTRQSQKL